MKIIKSIIESPVAMICLTFFAVLVVYCILSEKKRTSVNKEMILLIQILPITQIVKSFTGKKKTEDKGIDNNT